MCIHLKNYFQMLLCSLMARGLKYWQRSWKQNVFFGDPQPQAFAFFVVNSWVAGCSGVQM